MFNPILLTRKGLQLKIEFGHETTLIY